MATRKPLFMNSTEGYHEQMADSDDLVLGGLVMNTGGSGIDMNHQPLVNLDAPVNPEDAATKAYVDAIASGLDVHESCVTKTAEGLGDEAVRAGAGGGGVALPMAGETVDIQLHDSPAGTNVTVTFTNEANLAAVKATIDAALQAVYTDFSTFDFAVVNGNNIDLYDPFFGAHSKIVVSNITEGTPGDLQGKTGISAGTTSGTGFTAAGSGVGKTLEAPANGTSYNTIGGFTLTAVGQRVLVTTEAGIDTTTDVDNGIYEVTTLGAGGAKLKLTRTTDADSGAATELHNGTYTFITGIGGTYENTGWTMVTPDPITVDTTPMKWSQFGGVVTYTFDQGLKKIVSSIQVDLDTACDAQGTGAAGGQSGLEFDVDTASGQLRVKVDPVKGITRNANGIGILLNGTTLEFEGSNPTLGLRVKGLPNLFEIGGTATSQTPGVGQVTATALNTITAGSASNADAYHTHASSPATEAPKIENTMDGTGGTVAVGDPVYITAVNNIIDEADTSPDLNARVIGIARLVPSANAIEVVSAGLCTSVLGGGGVAGTPYYLADGGGLTTSLPGAGKRVVQVGIAVNANDLFVRIVDYGKKAA